MNSVRFFAPTMLMTVGSFVFCAPGFAADSSVLANEFIYEKASFPSCHASTICQTPQGLIAAFFGGSDEGEPDVGIWVSRHEGGKWSEPVEAANGVESP